MSNRTKQQFLCSKVFFKMVLKQSLKSMKWKIVSVSVICITILFLSAYQEMSRSPPIVSYLMGSQTDKRNSTIPLEREPKTFQTHDTTKTLTLKREVTDPKAVFLSQQKRPPFDPDFKNPCWRTRSKTLECLPYFYLAGFPKSGTTDMYYRLVEHPFILGGREKEPHHLTRRYFLTNRLPCDRTIEKYVHTSCDILTYANIFFRRTATNIDRPFSVDGTSFLPGELSKIQFKRPMITVDGSASTAWDNSNGYHIIRDIRLSEKVSSSNSSILDWIVQMNPGVRFLLILREPVSRLYSDYNYFHGNTSAATFHDEVNIFLRWFSHCLESGRSDLACARLFDEGPIPLVIRPHISLYHTHLQDLLLRIPKDRTHMMRAEDYHNNKTHSLQQIFKFLDLPLLSPKAMSKVLSNSDRNVNQKKVKPMWTQTRQKLIDFYRPYNEKLAKLLRNDAFLWEDVYIKYKG